MTLEIATLREFLRVSRDKSGRERSPNEQHDDLQADADRQRWTVHPEPYRDIGRASRYSKAQRDKFDKLIADIESGRFGADALGLWEGSRGSRKVSEWALLIDLLDEHGIKVWIHTHHRLYDPSNPRDRRTLHEEAVDSEYESGKSSERLRRTMAASAVAGKPHGRIATGFQRIYDPKTRALVAQEKEPEKAPLMKELFHRVYNGQSIRCIHKNWKKRGILNGSGRPYSQQHMRDILMRPSYAGLRVHDPNRRGRYLSPTAKFTKGDWPEIVSPKVFFAVQKIISDPDRVKNARPGRAVHWLSGIALCDPCDGKIGAKTIRGLWKYRCQPKGCIVVDEAELDAFAEQAVLEYLSRPDIYEALRGSEEASAELRAVEDELAMARNEVDELARNVAAGKLSVTFAAQVESGIQARVLELETRERELATPPALAGFLEPGGDVAQRWEEAELSTRRTVARELFTPQWIGELRITRSPTGGPCPAVDRVVFRREAS